MYNEHERTGFPGNGEDELVEVERTVELILHGCDDYGAAALQEVDTMKSDFEQIQYLINLPTAELSVEHRMFVTVDERVAWESAFEAIASDNHWYRTYTLPRSVYDHFSRTLNQPAKPKPMRVVCAAMLMKDNTIVPGLRHFSPEMREILKRLYGEPYHTQVVGQGFLLSDGRYATREEALKIARKNGQMLYRCGGDTHRLFSENLY